MRDIVFGPTMPFISVPTRKQKVIIFSGPDRCGKTNIAQGLAADLHVPYYKKQEDELWRKGQFLEALRFGETEKLELVRQARLDVIMDRGYPCEWAYSQVFIRDTDMALLERIDREYARLGAYIIIPLRHDYDAAQPDSLVSVEKNKELHAVYQEFMKWTRCSTVAIYVDAFDNKLGPELEVLKKELRWGESLQFATNVVLDRSKTKKDVSDIFEPGSDRRSVALKMEE